MLHTKTELTIIPTGITTSEARRDGVEGYLLRINAFTGYLKSYGKDKRDPSTSLIPLRGFASVGMMAIFFLPVKPGITLDDGNIYSTYNTRHHSG